MEAFFILVCIYAASVFERHVLQRTEKTEWITFGLCSFLVQPFLSQDIFWFSQLFSYYETRKKSILVNIELYNVDEQIKNHFY